MKTKSTKISLSTINKVLAYSRNRETLQSIKDASSNFIGMSPTGATDKTTDAVALQVYCAGKTGVLTQYDTAGYVVSGPNAHWRRFNIPSTLLMQAIDACLEKQAKEMEDLGVDVDV